MAYATVSDVRGKAPQLEIDAHSRPSDADVQRFISSIDTRVNAALAAQGYTVPITTGPESLAILRDLVAIGALADTLDAIVFGRGTTQDIGQKAARDRFTTDLVAVAKGTLVLPDETPGYEPVQPDSILVRSNLPELGEDDTDAEGNPLVTRHQRF